MDHNPYHDSYVRGMFEGLAARLNTRIIQHTSFVISIRLSSSSWTILAASTTLAPPGAASPSAFVEPVPSGYFAPAPSPGVGSASASCAAAPSACVELAPQVRACAIPKRWVGIRVLRAASATLAPPGAAEQSACVKLAPSLGFSPAQSPSVGSASASSRN
jgi:hypothetical protein